MIELRINWKQEDEWEGGYLGKVPAFSIFRNELKPEGWLLFLAAA